MKHLRAGFYSVLQSYKTKIQRMVSFILSFGDSSKFELDKLKAKMQILRRYHGGDGSVTREEVMKALADD